MLGFLLILTLGMHETACPLFIFIFYHCLETFLTAIQDKDWKNGEQDPIICG